MREKWSVAYLTRERGSKLSAGKLAPRAKVAELSLARILVKFNLA